MQNDTITVAGQEFNVPTRYAAGYQLNEAEADALNQTFHENLGNNFRKKVKEALGDDGDSLDEETQAALQAELDKYAEEYEFGVRVRSAKSPANPIEKEALNLAKATIRQKLKVAGKKADAESIAQAAATLIGDKEGRGAPFWTLAAKRIEEAKAAASSELSDLIDEMPEKAADTAE